MAGAAPAFRRELVKGAARVTKPADQLLGERHNINRLRDEYWRLTDAARALDRPAWPMPAEVMALGARLEKLRVVCASLAGQELESFPTLPPRPVVPLGDGQ